MIAGRKRWRPMAQFALLCPALVCADESRIAENLHLGVASCASSVCHGKLSRQDAQNVWLNEYRLWTSDDDSHSRAYQVLREDESRRIAANLGLDGATTAKVCLDCHADNVPADKRGPRFQISDGVGCEACHGGAENWITSHAAAGVTHAENLSKGMYPTDSPVDRAQLCLSCHMGSPAKFAGHDIMGAGHPRLSFELESFTVNQPAHYEVDDDYRARKREIPGFNLWLAGQVESAHRFITLVRDRIIAGSALYPELALYDCHACHHPMDDKRWTPVRGPGIGPGTLRIQDQHLQILQSAVSVIETDDDALASATTSLVRAGQYSADDVRSAADTLLSWLGSRRTEWATRNFDSNIIRAVRKAIVSSAAAGRMHDYNAAEQVYLSLESLSYTLGDRDSLAAALDRIYTEVENDVTFRPASFAATAGAVTSEF